jgi:GNAT superfamily N-acetyltransferase
MAGMSELIDRMLGADAAGRLNGRGPHFYLLRTPHEVICRVHTRVDPDAVLALEQIAMAERGRQRDWPLEYGHYLRILGSLATVKAVRAGPLFTVPASVDTAPAATRIGRDNVDLLRGGLDEWLPDAAAGRLIYAALADGRAVSICASVQSFAGAHVAGVETLPAYRGRGLGAQTVAAWATAVARLNATALFGTSFDNLASQGIARRLGMTLLGAEFSIECDFPEHPRDGKIWPG